MANKAITRSDTEWMKKQTCIEYEVRGQWDNNGAYCSWAFGQDLAGASKRWFDMYESNDDWDVVKLVSRVMDWKRDQIGEDETHKYYRKTPMRSAMRRVVKQIGQLNDACLEPDEMAWGPITREEADDYFNDPDCIMHEEWGTKSMNILMYNSDYSDWGDL